MKSIFTLFLLWMVLAAKSQTYQSSCTPTAQMVQLYKNDAYKYATLRLVRINSTYKDSIEIPTIYRDSVAKVFYAIHNMSPNPVKDTILNLFGFTNFSSYLDYEADSLHFNITEPPTYINSVGIGNLSAKTVDMYVSNTIPWANDWAAGNYNNTSEPRINQLVNQYQLTITTASSLPGTYYYKAKSRLAVNTLGMARRFNEIINSTTACTAFRYIGDGNAVGLDYEADGVKVSYRNGCGDCIAGCRYERRWTFKVYWANCNVEYLGASNAGEPSPPGSNVYTCTRGPVLPVTFGAVTGYLQNGQPALNWKVLTQLNVKEYIIERSEDGSQFYTMDRVVANTATTAEYNWKDAQVLNGTAWFRIKAVDADGKSKYSPVVRLSNSKSGGIVIYPNPVQNHQFTIQFATPLSGAVAVRLYDLSGKLMWNNNISLTPQTSSRSFVLPSALPAGTYSVVMQHEAVIYRQTLVIENK